MWPRGAICPTSLSSTLSQLRLKGVGYAPHQSPLFLAAVLNPAVNWLQRRHQLIKRPIAIALTYLGVVVALLFVVGIFLPLLVEQINGLIDFVVAVAKAPEGPTEYIKGLAEQNGLRGIFERVSGSAPVPLCEAFPSFKCVAPTVPHGTGFVPCGYLIWPHPLLWRSPRGSAALPLLASPARQRPSPRLCGRTWRRVVPR